MFVSAAAEGGGSGGVPSAVGGDAERCDAFVNQAMEEMGNINIYDIYEVERQGESWRGELWLRAERCAAALPPALFYPPPPLPAGPPAADVCLNGPAKQARQLALMLRGHPAGASSRHLITGA